MKRRKLNDSVINFYLNYLFTRHIYDQLAIEGFSEQEVDSMFAESQFKQKSSMPEFISSIVNHFSIFSTFFYPLLNQFHKSHDENSLNKIRKWEGRSSLFTHDFVLIPLYDSSIFLYFFIYSNHFSLAVLCYPNKLAEYINSRRIVNGVDYFQGSFETAQNDSNSDKLVDSIFSLESSLASSF